MDTVDRWVLRLGLLGLFAVHCSSEEAPPAPLSLLPLPAPPVLADAGPDTTQTRGASDVGSSGQERSATDAPPTDGPADAGAGDVGSFGQKSDRSDDLVDLVDVGLEATPPTPVDAGADVAAGDAGICPRGYYEPFPTSTRCQWPGGICSRTDRWCPPACPAGAACTAGGVLCCEALP